MDFRSISAERLLLLKALMTGRGYLEREGLIAEIPTKEGWYFITDKGKTIRSREDLNAYRASRMLPKYLFHPVIARKVEEPSLTPNTTRRSSRHRGRSRARRRTPEASRPPTSARRSCAKPSTLRSARCATRRRLIWRKWPPPKCPRG